MPSDGYFINGMYHLYKGDCFDFLDEIKSKKPDAIVSDPPYGMNFRLTKTTAGACPRKMDKNVMAGDNRPFDPSPWLEFPVVLLWGIDHYFPKITNGGGTFLAWDKAEGYGPKNDFIDCEFAWTSKEKIKRNIFRYVWKGMIRKPDGLPDIPGKSPHHLTEKPVPLMKWCLDILKLPKGSLVVDPYMGSGPTGIACIQTGMKFIGCEIDEMHFKTAESRIRNAAQNPGFQL